MVPDHGRPRDREWRIGKTEVEAVMRSGRKLERRRIEADERAAADAGVAAAEEIGTAAGAAVDTAAEAEVDTAAAEEVGGCSSKKAVDLT